MSYDGYKCEVLKKLFRISVTEKKRAREKSVRNEVISTEIVTKYLRNTNEDR